jgi:hypothetical protein
LVDEWVTGIGLRREEYGTHSLRRTKASIIYKATGNLRAVQILLGHTKIENTVQSEHAGSSPPRGAGSYAVRPSRSLQRPVAFYETGHTDALRGASGLFKALIGE